MAQEIIAAPAPSSQAAQSLVKVKASDLRASREVVPPSKSDIIRANPDVSAAEVVTKAKALGVSLTPAHVYAVRSRDAKMGRSRASGRAAPKKAAPAAPKKQQPTSATSTLSADDMDMARLLLEVGLDRSEQLLAQLRRALEA